MMDNSSEHEKKSPADPLSRCVSPVSELNVREQCRNIVKTAEVQQSYAKNSFPIVHGWVFNLHNGLLTDLKIDFPAMLKDVQKVYNITEE
ncbi:carbonate dehydratase [Fusarium oxysporum f. sp. melonis 26406]|uniref:Carbonate dehydratase n=1 Tax=Fusarium oxysporum f. sp. melonis 26406 TaxID=1089452 RepID=W9Z1J8_FUSOX|nr:carbonate dehydratase [Fusarium oxysporum f. sp. melonis 26406]